MDPWGVQASIEANHNKMVKNIPKAFNMITVQPQYEIYEGL
jgi:hypothetical protein